MNPISSVIASSGLCASRAFVPAFIAAAMLRFGADNEALRQASEDLIKGGQAVSWFTTDASLIVLGILAALELAAQRNHDARALLAEVDHWIKPAMAVLTALGLMSVSDAEFAEQIAPHEAGILSNSLALFAGATTYGLAVVRNQVHQLLHDADSDNSTGVHTLLAWIEDAYAVFGMFLFVLFPLLISILIGCCIGVMFLLGKRARAREDATKVPCGSCAAPMYRSALRCAKCGAANSAPCRVNWLGVATDKPAAVETQPLALRAKHRCPNCASRLTERTAAQACGACGTRAFASAAEVEAYDGAIRRRVIPVLGVATLIGLVPVFGMIIGVLYYRIRIVSPYRMYVPPLTSMFARWVLRLVLFVLVVVQVVPLLGAGTLPLMALLSHRTFRRAFLREAARVSEQREPALVAQPA